MPNSPFFSGISGMTENSKSEKTPLPIQLDECGWYPSVAEDVTVRWKSTPEDTWVSGDAEVQISPNKTQSARVLKTLCSNGELAAASIRFSGGDKTPSHSDPPPIEDWDWRLLKPSDRSTAKFAVAPEAIGDVVARYLGLCPTLYRPDQLGNLTEDCARLSLKDPMHSGLREVPINPSGLIVVAGGTGTGKSLYAKSILFRWLLRRSQIQYQEQVARSAEEKSKFQKLIKKITERLDGGKIRTDEEKKKLQDEMATHQQRMAECEKEEIAKYVPPNLVSYEDPIEGWDLIGLPPTGGSPVEVNLNKEAHSDLAAGIRLTARAQSEDINSDVKSLKAGCHEALRQKPAVFYIGECRKKSDWIKAIQLGSTGHLVVTTCHASTLIDTFSKLAGMDGRDAQSRRTLANSLLGVLHLRQAEVTSKLPDLSKQQTLFHLWRRTPESVSNFVVDGLSSLVSDGENVISRSRLVREALSLQSEPANTYDLSVKENLKIYQKLQKCMSIAARALDLEGL